MLHATILDYLSGTPDVCRFFKKLMEDREEVVLMHNEFVHRPSVSEYLKEITDDLKKENSLMIVIADNTEQKLPILYRTDFNTEKYNTKNKIISSYPQKHLNNYFIKHILTNMSISLSQRVDIVHYCLYYYNFIQKDYFNHKHLIAKVKFELSDFIKELSINQYTTYRDCDPDSKMLDLFKNKLEDEMLNIEL